MSVIDDYINNQAEIAQPHLNQIRKILRSALPEAEERIAWRMPTFWKTHNIIHFAAFKNHMGLYPGPQAIEHFKEELSTFNHTKGAIQFPYDKPLPEALIKEIAKWCLILGKPHAYK